MLSWRIWLGVSRFIEGQGLDSGEIQATLTLFASAGDVVAKLKEAYDNLSST